MSYTTKQAILDKVGVTTTQLDDNVLDQIIIDSDAEVDRILKTTCKPTQDLKIFQGNGINYLYLNKIPLLSVHEIKIDETDVSAENYRFNKEGQIRLLNTAEQTFFYTNTKPNVAIKYLYGWVEEDIVTEIQEDVDAGNDVEITLNETENLYVKQWVRIVGTDTHEEWVKIKEKDDTEKTITCDLLYSHNSGSYVIKGVTPRIVSKLAAVVGAIMGAVHMVGSTYDFATGYTVPDFSIQKGEPYPAFLRVIDDLIKERDFLINQIVPFPVFA